MFAFLKNLFQAKNPNAAIAWQQVGNETGKGFWMFAAPVHLVLQRDSFSLAEPVPLPLESEEADALTATLNKHFEADDLKFFWHEKQWFLRLDSNPQSIKKSARFCQQARARCNGRNLPTKFKCCCLNIQST
jgi:hypothetical protein